MTKSIVFDTGPIISLAMNNILWALVQLKEKFSGEFYITPGVKRECVDKPLMGKKFKFEAMRTLKLIEDGTLKLFEEPTLKDKTMELLTLSNSLFKAHDNYVRNVQYGEVEAVVAAKMLKAEAVVIDEFITRSLLENPLSVKKRMEKKLHMNVEVDKNNLNRFKEQVRGIKVIRSVELVTVAYELGIFERYYLDIKDPKKNLLDGLLWALKLNGCSITEQEIQEVMKIEKF